MMYDTATFGGFSHALLRSFRDEHRKATVMAFSVLSDIMPHNVEMGYVCLIILGCSSVLNVVLAGTAYKENCQRCSMSSRPL